jgi:hypothetical protein
MKANTSVAYLVMLLMCSSLSQAQDDKGYIGFSLGPSIPLGDLSSKDYDSEEAGWAKTGAVFDLSFAYRVGTGNFGVTAMLRGQVNPVDEVAYDRELSGEFPGVSWKVESDAWKSFGIMIGVFGSFPVSEQVYFDPRVLVGIANTTAPASTVTAAGPGGTAWVKTDSQSSLSLAYLIGAGFKFNVARNIYLLTNIDYRGTGTEFRDVEITASDGSRGFDTWSLGLGSFSLTAGVAVKL